jgi:Zn-dependent M28 family amino/carboxypeptidase
MIRFLSVLLAAAAAVTPAASENLSPRAQAWWDDIKVLADDGMEGRLTGSPGYLRAADYVEQRFKAEGLAPAGENGGYRQDVALTQQTVNQAASRAALVDDAGARTPLTVGEDMLISAGGGSRPQAVNAPLVFIGYGLHLPESGHDDFAGLDLKGKIAVVISGGPADIPGPVKSAARYERAVWLVKAGAVGLIILTTPKQVEIPWARQKLLSGQPGMYLSGAEFHDSSDGFLAASIDPAASERLFEGSGHGFAELSALADASRPVPTFVLARRLEVQVAATRTAVSSPNLVAKLEGSDPGLKGEYVAVSAHLDHLGVGAPINGESIYHGAMDDASGVASVLDIAHQLKTGRHPPRRSVLFVIVCAEEKGLLGSYYFASRPTVPAGAIVADLNFDMPLPLWPLKSVIAQGADESTLGDTARSVAAASGLALAPDPLPDRNSFIRTDQFSFVRKGVPALAFKFGFARDTPEFQIEHDWRANRYHAPSDDLQQPGVLKEEAVKLDAYVADLAARIADTPERPEWLKTSIFRRYATATPPRDPGRRLSAATAR